MNFESYPTLHASHRNNVLVPGSHWRHLARTIERSIVYQVQGLSAVDAVECRMKFSPMKNLPLCDTMTICYWAHSMGP